MSSRFELLSTVYYALPYVLKFDHKFCLLTQHSNHFLSLLQKRVRKFSCSYFCEKVCFVMRSRASHEGASRAPLHSTVQPIAQPPKRWGRPLGSRAVHSRSGMRFCPSGCIGSPLKNSPEGRGLLRRQGPYSHLPRRISWLQ